MPSKHLRKVSHTKPSKSNHGYLRRQLGFLKIFKTENCTFSKKINSYIS